MQCRKTSSALALAVCICAVVVLLPTPPLHAQNRAAAPSPSASNSGFIENQGIVLPARRFLLKLEPGERLDAVMVSKGDHVKAGQPLARISDPTITSRYVDLSMRQNDYQSLRDELESQTLDLALQRAALQRVTERIEKLKKLEDEVPDFSSAGDGDPLFDKKNDLQDQIAKGSEREKQLRHRVDLLKGMAGATERELGASQSRVDHDQIRAPFAGNIVDRILDAERPGYEAMVCELWDESTYTIEVEILQHQVAYVQPGRTALIALDFARSERVEGTVSYLEPGNLAPEALGHPRFKAIIALKQPVSWLRPGMQVAVRMRLDGSQ